MGAPPSPSTRRPSRWTRTSRSPWRGRSARRGPRRALGRPRLPRAEPRTGSRRRASPARPRRSWSGRGAWRRRGRGCAPRWRRSRRRSRGARTPVAVVIESDGLTEVAVSRVGRLGTLTRRTVDLRPGEYTATGLAPRLPRRPPEVHRERPARGRRRRRALRGGPVTDDPRRGGGARAGLGPADFPVPLGGPGSPVPVAGSGGPLAWLGLADGEVFVQPSPGASVLCNGTRLSASHWLRDGDALRLGPDAGRGEPPGGRPAPRRLGPGRGEPHRAARRPRPPAARRATLARGRPPGAPIRPIGYTPRRSGPSPRPRRRASRPDARPRGLCCSRRRAGLPRLAAGRGRRRDRSRARHGRPPRPLAGRPARLALRGVARPVHARGREGRLPPARGAGRGDGRGGAGDRASRCSSCRAD